MNERIVITITLEPDGKVNVNGPLENKVMMYGLLSIAKDLVQEFKAKTIDVPRFIPPGGIRGNG